MTQYLLSVHSVDGEVRDPMTEEEMQRSWKQIQILNEELKSAGALGLLRPAARTRDCHRGAHGRR